MYDAVGGGDRELSSYYVYPEHYAPRGGLPETTEHYIPRAAARDTLEAVQEADAPCDLSNWHVRSASRFERGMADNERLLADNERLLADSGGAAGAEPRAPSAANYDEHNPEQPINFAYYHF